MRDVAQQAGVSLKTVSRVINGEPGVGAATAERVTAAIAALGFERNDLAHTLRRGGGSATLGLLIEDVSNPFYSSIVEAVEDAARERGYLLITASCEENPELEREMVAALRRRRVDALLIVSAGADHGRDLRTTPAVFLDRPPVGVDADTVLLDNAGGARRAVEHLLAQGHRRIAFVSDRATYWTARQRLAGYEAAMDAAGVEVDPWLVRTEPHRVVEATEAVLGLLSLPAGRRPTAIFAANNRHMVGALRALRDRPLGVAVVGFDDLELADLLATPATVVRGDPYEMGRLAAVRAFARLDGEQGPPVSLVVPTDLVVRGSGEIPPAVL
jgi:LacI family transcriptional regulator